MSTYECYFGEYREYGYVQFTTDEPPELVPALLNCGLVTKDLYDRLVFTNGTVIGRVVDWEIIYTPVPCGTRWRLAYEYRVRN